MIGPTPAHVLPSIVWGIWSGCTLSIILNPTKKLQINLLYMTVVTLVASEDTAVITLAADREQPSSCQDVGQTEYNRNRNPAK